MDPTAQSWLDMNCQFIKGTKSAVVLLGTPDVGPFELMASWPHHQAVSSELVQLANILLESNKQAAISQDGDMPDSSVIMCPILVGGHCFGAITLLIEGSSKELRSRVCQLLGWGCEWFAKLAQERKNYRQQDSRLLGFVESIATVLKHEDLQQTAQALVDSMRERRSCLRVSLGLVKNSHCKIVAISDCTGVAELSGLVKPLQEAMDEAMDQSATLLITPTHEATGQISFAHQQLMQEHQINSVCTIPMIHNQDVVGAVTLEGLDGDNFEEAALRFCEQVILMAGPILALKNKSASTLAHKIRQGSRERGIRVFAVTFITLLLAGIFFDGEYQVVADATLVSAKKQLVTASQDGFIASSHARPGDLIEANQLLATLAGEDLKLEQKKKISNIAQIQKTYNNALGQHDRVKISISLAQLAQARAQLDLIENQLQRLSLRAPFAGLLLTGDLSQSLGSPVNRGDVLFEVASIDDYHLKIAVNESEIVEIKLQQRGRVLLVGLPKKPLHFQIKKITPVVAMENSKSFFIVEAQLDVIPQALTPGMTGVAKIDIEKRSLMWIALHGLFRRIELWFWRL
ncbi:MAG: HlyD family efflux transporter periplasmic adaptor subunit [Pseudomonadales bacterium]|nr:HlyD family efflux transporter periplasmic adaptor subunit [Pseudomonadales bacterium]